jgi:hypothetical protein
LKKLFLLILILCIGFVFTNCKNKSESQANGKDFIKYDIVLSEFHENYCYDNGICHTFYINVDSIWDETTGGCMKVKQVIQTSDTYEVICETIEYSENVTQKKISRWKNFIRKKRYQIGLDYLRL